MVWLISVFEKKISREIPAGKNSRGKDLAGKKPSGEKTWRGKERWRKDLAEKNWRRKDRRGKDRRGEDLAPNKSYLCRINYFRHQQLRLTRLLRKII